MLPFGFFTIGFSLRLSDRSEVTQNKINIVKFAPVGFEPTTSRSAL